MKVNDILVCSWGYDQTNVDFYKVVKATESSVWLVEIGKTISDEGYMCGYCMPDPNSFDPNETPKMHRISKGNSVRITSYSHAYPWDGKKRYVSWYA